MMAPQINFTASAAKGQFMTSNAVSVEDIVRRRKRGLWRGWLIWPLLLALAASGLWYYESRTAVAAAPHYVTQKVTKGAITVLVSAVGTVEPIDQVNVSSEISGIVRKVNVAINDKVTTGQVLASLDTSGLEAELARNTATVAAQKAQVADAEATLDEATAALTRAQKMVDRGVTSAEALTTAETAKRRADAGLASAQAGVQVAEADLLVSQANLSKTCICSPIDGVVLDLDVAVGQTVSASSGAVTLFTLAHDLGQMRLQVDVDEADIGKVAVGDAATFSVEAYQGQSFPAKVTELHYAPQTVDGVVTYRTILAIDNRSGQLRPGMTASADITVDGVTDVLEVPNAAFRYAPPVVTVARKSSGLLGMLFSSGGPGQGRQNSTTTTASKQGYRNLWVLKDGTTTQIAVKTGVTDGDMTQVLDGPLVEGDAVITSAATTK